ncbi:N-acetyltransferase [Sporosarcina sp. Te-1]|uniref:GNAT family N-acetyltransferase n=1 Tax=Sporosarcina sp. Te-1 TaxID=2818390 RepID=UPI001A9CEEAF|nr:N-acetyltransferase [Sporosarcina sp. Te-1]QTD42566.1 GNAT family N-acetyltransferase [Sporosarcina sp. Te-1]
MSVTIENPRNIRELAFFLAEVNKRPAYHVGYCGEKTDEIIDALLHDFSDVKWSQSFKVAYDSDRIIGALGFDVDLTDQSAEVWGPFVLEEDLELAGTLWDVLYETVVDQVKHFHFFYPEQNETIKRFIAKQGGAVKGGHVVLSAQKGEHSTVVSDDIEMYEASYWTSFQALHNESFPQTYYDAETICNRLNEYNQLLLLTTADEQIKGYVYVEADPLHQSGSIEYIAVSSAFQKQGIGTRLLQEALVRLFAFEEINEIRLCVSTSNAVAIRLYKAAGFYPKQELIHSVITTEGR